LERSKLADKHKDGKNKSTEKHEDTRSGVKEGERLQGYKKVERKKTETTK
jgi:hypothetical protein